MTSSLDGSFKLVILKSMKVNANFSINFHKSEYDVDHVRSFDEQITYTFNNKHK